MMLPFNSKTENKFSEIHASTFYGESLKRGNLKRFPLYVKTFSRTGLFLNQVSRGNSS